MITKSIITVLLAASLLVIPGAAQTAAELLQKAIFAQETEGNLDAAIQIYRQIVISAYPQREIAAQAQYRLGQALLRKGDLAGAAKEFEKLARDFSEYREVVMKEARGSLTPPQPGGRGGRGAASPVASFEGQRLYQAVLKAQPMQNPPAALDVDKPVTVQGVVTRVMWANPNNYIYVQGTDQTTWAFEGAAPNKALQIGWTRDSFKPGDQITVEGYLTKDGAKLPDGSVQAVGMRIALPDGRKMFWSDPARLQNQ